MTSSKKGATKQATKKPASKTTTKRGTRKSATKAAPKKTSPKRVVKLRAMVCAEGEQCFWTTDGRVLKDLEQLHMAFGSMDDEVFLHHVTKEKNDFADWVEAVLEDAACAADLRRSRKASSAKTTVARHLKQYQTK